MEVSPRDYSGPTHQCAGEGCRGEEHLRGEPFVAVIKGVGVADYTTKATEIREYGSGMKRDTTKGKLMMSLVFDGPMLRRWAALLTRGATRYGLRNWMNASSDEELQHAKDSASRHFDQWLRGETDEDHAAATMFNINEAEHIKEKMKL